MLRCIGRAASLLVVIALAPGCAGAPGDPAPDPAEDAADDVAADAVALDASVAAPDQTAPDAFDVVDAFDAALDAPTGDDEDAGPEPHPLLEALRGVELTEHVDDAGALHSSGVGVMFRSAPFWDGYGALGAEGACTYYLYTAPTPCDPACDAATSTCSHAGDCVPHPQRLSAGVVTVGGLGVEVVATPDDTAWYSVEGELPLDAFGPGDTITFDATGGEVGAFSVELPGVGDMDSPLGWSIELIDGQDHVVTWTPQGDGATVELALQTGWHGAPSPVILWCTGPDEAGEIVIPQALVEAFPPAGSPGLFPHQSILRRVHRAWVQGPTGLHEVVVQSRRYLDTLH